MNEPEMPRIRKAKWIRGKNLVFRDATPNDAAFIPQEVSSAWKTYWLTSARLPILESRSRERLSSDLE